MKKNTKNKTEFIQFRVDSTVKDLAKKIANEHFDGNMSDMFRYSLYHCNFCGSSGNVELDSSRNSFTRMSDDASKMLAVVHDQRAGNVQSVTGDTPGSGQLGCYPEGDELRTDCQRQHLEESERLFYHSTTTIV